MKKDVQRLKVTRLEFGSLIPLPGNLTFLMKAVGLLTEDEIRDSIEMRRKRDEEVWARTKEKQQG